MASLQATHDLLDEEQEARLVAEQQVTLTGVQKDAVEEQLREANRDKGKADLDLDKLQTAHSQTLGEVNRLTRQGDEASRCLSRSV